jgi:carbonic anhydrase
VVRAAVLIPQPDRIGEPAGSDTIGTRVVGEGARLSVSEFNGRYGVAAASQVGRLRAGNDRFLQQIAQMPDPAAAAAELARADPYAVILGCSDSRVSPEIIFNETVGRLFVIRVASNVAGNEETATVEYALARWRCPLVVVLGHTQCGGVAAAMSHLPPGAEAPLDASSSMHLSSLISTVRSNLGWIGVSSSSDPWTEAVRLNVRHTMKQLLTSSMALRHRADSGELSLVGAIYHVETGAVEFLDPGA